MIKENLEEVKRRIGEACKRTGRDLAEVTLIAVSKTKPVDYLEEAYVCGVRDFGENKVQEICEKYEALPKDARFHMICHLQRNKVSQVLDKAVLIHSVDSLRLAKQIEKEGVAKGLTAEVLLEVNVAKEESKFGFLPEEVEQHIREIAKFSHIRIKGLMTIAPFVENSEENRIVFQKLHELYIDIRRKNIDNVSMTVLSMGMTGDYEIAVEEGATLVRVGTGIFGAR